MLLAYILRKIRHIIFFDQKTYLTRQANIQNLVYTKFFEEVLLGIKDESLIADSCVIESSL